MLGALEKRSSTEAAKLSKEDNLWTLVLFTMLASTAGAGSSTVTTFRFNTKEQCEAAEKALAEAGNLGGQDAAAYRIWGKCIAPR